MFDLSNQANDIITFEDLDVYKQCRSLRKSLRKLCDQLPYSEKYKLKDQIVRASRSVTANIAEGYGRFHYKENVQFCRISRGSLYELIDHLNCAQDEGYITDSLYNKIRDEIIRCIKLVNGYINYLIKKQSER